MKNKIITISREFGSGGRELGKRMADILGYSYYDRETVTEIAKRMKKDEKVFSLEFPFITIKRLPTFPLKSRIKSICLLRLKIF